ncbi:MAG: PEP-CTERM sorting domain-containing protein [Fuerstiella sp.]
MAASVGAAMVSINSKTFDLGQFTGASVTYRTGGSVAFDGKVWDNEVGVDNYTLGELAAGQYGSDPGDQVTLQHTGSSGPDWLQLNYAGPGIGVGAGSEFVIYEITSSSSGVDTEGTSFRVSFNGGSFINASSADATFLAASSIPGTTNAENTNQIVFDLSSILSPGSFLNTVRIENLNSGGGTSDPDFIFAAVTASSVPEPSLLAQFGIGSLLGLCWLRRRHTLLKLA